MVILALAICFGSYYTALVHAERWPSNLGTAPFVPIERKRLIQAVLLALAFILAWRNRLQTFGRLGALLLAAVGTAPAFPHEEFVAVWRKLPVPLATMLWIPQVSHFFILPLLFAFYGSIPRPILRSPLTWICAFLPAAAGTVWGVYHLALRLHAPPHAVDLPNWLLLGAGLCILGYGFGGLTLLFANWRKAPPLVRARLHVLTFGAIAGWSLGLLFLAAIFLAPLTTSPLVWWFVSRPFKLAALALSTLVPVTLAWAVFKDRVFDLTKGGEAEDCIPRAMPDC